MTVCTCVCACVINKCDRGDWSLSCCRALSMLTNKVCIWTVVDKSQEGERCGEKASKKVVAVLGRLQQMPESLDQLYPLLRRLSVGSLFCQ